jgi:hypothetical protein
MAGEMISHGMSPERVKLARQELGALNQAVEQCDLESAQLVANDLLLPTSMVAGHMDLMRRYTDESVRPLWRQTLGSFLLSLEGKTLPSSQVAIDRIRQNLEIDTMMTVSMIAEGLDSLHPLVRSGDIG